MTSSRLIIALAALAVIAVGPADARHRNSARSHCVDRPTSFSWYGVFFGPAPRPNGCSPAVYNFGHFIGQDPDPNIRFQLMRDPGTGYTSDLTR
jgi:hypothetical protein